MIAIPQLRMAKLLSFMDDAAKPGGYLMMYRVCSALDKAPPSIERLSRFWRGKKARIRRTCLCITLKVIDAEVKAAYDPREGRQCGQRP
jgi:hypothetical protein